MIHRIVVLAPEARDDLLHLYAWIAEAASPTVALSFIERVETYLRGLDVASERGTRRDDIRPGLRTVGFARRLTIAFTVDASQVTILCVFYAGCDWRAALDDA